jgi:hypothetical protein
VIGISIVVKVKHIEEISERRAVQRHIAVQIPAEQPEKPL